MSRILFSCLLLVLLGLSLEAGAIILQPVSKQQSANGLFKQLAPADTLFSADAEIDEDEDCGHNQRVQSLKRASSRCFASIYSTAGQLPDFECSRNACLLPPSPRYLLLCHFRM